MTDEPTLENVKKTIEDKLKNSDINVNVKSLDGKSFEITLIKGTETAKKSINVTKKNKPNNSPEDNKNNVVSDKSELENTIKDKLKEFPEEIFLTLKDGSTLQDSLNAISKIMKENPDLNYGYAGCGAKSYGNNVTLKMKYSLSKEKMIEEKNAVKNKVQEILKSEIKNGMNDFQKELALHDYIVKNARYDTEHVNDNPPLPEDHNAYGVLVNGVGVCESYAKAMYELLNAAGIQCKYATGVGTNSDGNSENHAWNMVKLEDGWYNVDATWDDPVFKNSKNPIPVQHGYFNLTDSIMNKTHQRNKIINEKGKLVNDTIQINYPIAEGTKYSVENMKMKVIEYDIENDPFVPVLSMEDIEKKIKDALDNHKEKLNLKLYGFKMSKEQVSKAFDKVVKKKTVGSMETIGENYIVYNFKYNK